MPTTSRGTKKAAAAATTPPPSNKGGAGARGKGLPVVRRQASIEEALGKGKGKGKGKGGKRRSLDGELVREEAEAAAVEVVELLESDDEGAGTAAALSTRVDGKFKAAPASPTRTGAAAGAGAAPDRPVKRARGVAGAGVAGVGGREKEVFVPEHLHRVVIYQRAGRKELTEAQHRVFDFVARHFHLPSDLEASHHYGPLSGSCYEERALAAYRHGLLAVKPQFARLLNHDPKSPSSTNGPSHPVATWDDSLKACVTCGGVGHWPERCPEGL